MKVLALDFGGSSYRAVTCEYKSGNFYFAERFRFDNAPVMTDGYYRWNFDGIMRNIKGVLKELKNENISAIGIDTWGVDYGLVDDGGNLIDMPISYRDERTVASAEKVHEIIDKNALYKRNGLQFVRHNTLYQLYDDVLTGRLKLAETALLMPDLIAYFLTGTKRTEYTVATTTGLVNPNNRLMDAELMSALSLPKDIFAPMIMPGEKYGCLSPCIREETGVGPIPVYAVASHDTASAIMSVPEKDCVYISAGTWSLMGTLLDKPRFDDAHFTNEGGYGGKITYLTNITGMWLMQELRKSYVENGVLPSYNELDETMRDSGEVLYIDPEHKDFSAPTDMRAALERYISGYSSVSPTKGDLVKCIYHSLAMTYRKTYEKLGKSVPIYVVGGGVKAAPLMQLTSDIIGVRVITGASEATAIGNAACLFSASGAVPLGETLSKLALSEIKEYTPDPALKPHYDKEYEKFINITRRYS